MNNYEKACLKIQNYKRNNIGCCYCFGNTGPTGATGEAGLGSISIGTTSTGAAGTNATVTNTGTAQDAKIALHTKTFGAVSAFIIRGFCAVLYGAITILICRFDC